MGRAFGRRAATHRRSARCLDHRGGHRRADGRLDRRAAAAQGIPRAAARHLRPPRHFVDLRRSDHRLRAARPRLCRRALWRDAGPDRFRQGRDFRQRADGRRDRAGARLRCVHARPRTDDRTVSRLYLFGASAGLRRGPRRPRSLPRRTAVRAGARAGAALCRRRHGAERPAGRARHPHRRAHGRHRPRLASRRRRASAPTKRWTAPSATRA